MPHLTLADGELLHYDVTGDGPPLLLVSGLNGVGSFWAPHLDALGQRFTVVSHDHRGTGDSSPSRIDYSIEQMAEDVIQLMDHLSLDRADLIGHSTGGAIGQTIALDRPERLNRLVLCGTWTVADAYFRRLFAVRSAILKTMGAEAYVRSNALFMNPPDWLRDHASDVEKQEAQAIERFPEPEIMLSRIAAILRFDRSATLGQITAPTLVVGAEDDLVAPSYYSEDLGRLIPGAKTVMLPRGGHFFPVTEADAFRRHILNFLGQESAA